MKFRFFSHQFYCYFSIVFNYLAWLKVICFCYLLLPYLFSTAQASRIWSLDTLVEKSDAIAWIHVNFTASAKKQVQVKQWLKEPLQRVSQQSDRGWWSFCLPNQHTLKLLIKQYKLRKLSRPLWIKALKEGRYESIVFLKIDPTGMPRAVCGMETLSTFHWVDHPQFKEWFDKLQKKLQSP